MAVRTAVPPHGGQLVDLLVPPDRAASLRAAAARWPAWTLTRRQRCDLELLACGGFSPLRSFMGRSDYESVRDSMRLADGTLWPMPVTLDVPADVAASVRSSAALALRDCDGALLAVLRVSDAWMPDLRAEAKAVLGSSDPAHPGVAYLLSSTHQWYLTGLLEVLRLPGHREFLPLRHTPARLRAEFAACGWSRIVAFQTRNPMHRAHQQLTLRASADHDAHLLIQPVVGVTKPGDIDPGTRVRCYQAILPSYPPGRAMLSLLPLAMRMAGPREALWHAIIRKNYGASHFIVGRDHAGPGSDAAGRPFYGAYDAQALVLAHAAELGVRIVPFKRMVYLANSGRYVPEDEAPAGERVFAISGTEVRRWLAEGRELPAWFTPPEIAAVLRQQAHDRPTASVITS